MTTVTDTHDTHDDHDSAHEEHSDFFYVRIAAVLAILTALETSTYWVDFGPFFMPALITMMTIKFVMVVLFFMHLRFDSKWFNMAFWAGLGLAVTVYCAALATFHFFAAP
jgi:cytochrome c oxidase subunit IV